MSNEPENAAYWYLRLNGFFLIERLVIHQSEEVEYSADEDLLAVRMPFVYEEVGGQHDDWDPALFDPFDNANTIKGIVCQVKGGATGKLSELFRESNLAYCLQRLGFTKDVNPITEQLKNAAIATFTNEVGSECQIAKVLISLDTPRDKTSFLHISMQEVYKFINGRVAKYADSKSRDWHFFEIGIMHSAAYQERMKRS